MKNLFLILILSVGSLAQLQGQELFVKLKGKADSSAVTFHEIGQIEQNHPNPFSQSTLIAYHLNASADVKLEIFDIYGSVIKTIVDEKQTAGSYYYNWDASFHLGGQYFYELDINGQKQTKTMLVLR